MSSRIWWIDDIKWPMMICSYIFSFHFIILPIVWLQFLLFLFYPFFFFFIYGHRFVRLLYDFLFSVGFMFLLNINEWMNCQPICPNSNKMNWNIISVSLFFRSYLIQKMINLESLLNTLKLANQLLPFFFLCKHLLKRVLESSNWNKQPKRNNNNNKNGEKKKINAKNGNYNQQIDQRWKSFCYSKCCSDLSNIISAFFAINKRTKWNKIRK